MKITQLSAFPVLLVLYVSIFQQPTNAQGASSFADSCTNISINNGKLLATCKTKNGSNQNTSLTIQGVYNNNGQLVQGDISKASTFNQTCTDVSIDGDELSAYCRQHNGESRRSAVRLGGIHNNDGKLTY